MSNYVLLTDATADLPKELADRIGVVELPMEFLLEGTTYPHTFDAKALPIPAFYDRLRAGAMATTTQITRFIFLEAFEPILKAGQDILYVAFSSGLSGTFQESVLAAVELERKFPGRRVVCVDSRAASMGEGLLVWYAARKKAEGFPLEELGAWLTSKRDHLCHWFTVDDLGHLRRGGRVSPTAAVVGSMLQVKPVLKVDDTGHLVPVSKIRGRRKSLEALADQMAETALPKENQIIFIGHGDCEEDANLLATMLRERFSWVNEVVIGSIGPIIGAHAGPGTVALFYIGTQK